MSWIFPSAIATTVDTFVLVLVYLYLYFQNRERYLGIWTLGWSIYLIRFAFELWMLAGSKSAVPLVAIQIISFVSGLFLLWGTHIFLDKKISSLWLYGAGLTTVVMALGILSGTSFITSTLPAFAFLGIIYIWLGSSLLSHKQLEGIGRQVTGWGFIAWGIHKIDYPFLQPVTWFAPWGYLLGAMLEITVAVGILLIYVQQTKKELRAREERFRLLAENAQDLIYRYQLKPTPRFEYVSPSATTITGYTPDEFYADPQMCFRLTHPDDESLIESIKNSVILSEKPIILRWVKKNGELIWVEQRNTPVHDEVGDIVAFESIVRDITERKLAADKLKDSEERYRRLVELSPDAVAVHSEGRLAYINVTGAKMVGAKRPAELIGKPMLDFVHPDYHELVKSRVGTMAEGSIVELLEEKFLTIDGKAIDVEVAGMPINYNGRPAMQVYVRDITERKRREEELRFKSFLLDSAIDSVFVHDLEGKIVYVNEAGCKTRGYAKEELIGMTLQELDTPEFSEFVEEHIDLIKRDGSAVFEAAHFTKDGAVMNVEVHAQIMEFNGEEVIAAIARDITERKKTEKELIDREHRYRSIINGAAEGFWMINADLETVEVNDSLCDMLGYSKEEMLGKKPFDFVDEENLKVFKEQTAKIPGTSHRHYDIVLKSKSGEDVYTRFNATTIKDEDANTISAFAFVTNITELKLAEGALLDTKERMEQLYRVIPSAIFTVDKGGVVTSFNKKAEEITGYTAEEVIGNRCTVFALEPCSSRCGLFEGSFEAPVQARECTIRRKDGEIKTILKNLDLLKDASGNILGGVESFEDVTERKQTEKMLNYMAYYDSLTSLPNRMLLNDRLTLALSYAHRNKEMLGVLFLDLDNFKAINDTLGHTVGDKLLQCVSRRLAGCLREGDTIARLGGDEFVLLLPQIKHEEDAAKVANKVLEALKPPFSYEAQDFHITTSIGISLYPHDGKDAQTLLKNADAALYRAKEEGRNNYQLYTPAMNAKAFERLSLENSMRKALERGEFMLYYQPQIDLESCEITGMEALIRWQHPELGLIQPTDFIPIAEETGLIVPIGEWVLKTACKQGKKWQDMGYTPFRVSVNLSARQFRQQDVVEMIKQALSETGFDPEYLELEITESVLMHDSEITTETLLQVKEMGVKVSIDDFGTGYSSLSYLKQFPIDRLKIDRMFIHALTEDSNDAAIAKAIIAMAHNLGLKVVAEGVEETTQLEILRSLKCDEVQGHLLSLPLPVEDVTKLLEDGNRLCA